MHIGWKLSPPGFYVSMHPKVGLFPAARGHTANFFEIIKINFTLYHTQKIYSIYSILCIAAPRGFWWMVILVHPHTVHSVHNIKVIFISRLCYCLCRSSHQIAPTPYTDVCRFIIFKSKYVVDTTLIWCNLYITHCHATHQVPIKHRDYWKCVFSGAVTTRSGIKHQREAKTEIPLQSTI